MDFTLGRVIKLGLERQARDAEENAHAAARAAAKARDEEALNGAWGAALLALFYFSWGVVLPRLFYSLTHLRSPLHTRNTHTHTRARARAAALRTALMEKEPQRAVALTLADLAQHKREAALVQGEAKYQALQQLIMEQLGVKPEDVSTDLPVPLGGAIAAQAQAAPDAAAPGSPAKAPPSTKAATPKAGAPKPFSPSATQQQQGKKK